MHVLPTAEPGISRLKIVHTSFGVMIGSSTPPKATSGWLLEMGTMRVGSRKSLRGRVPLTGQVGSFGL